MSRRSSAAARRDAPLPIHREGLGMTFSQARKEARDEGRTEGRVEEAVRNLLTVLGVRGLAVPDTARERILAQKDPERLERWHERAILAASVFEVIDEPT